MRLPRLVTTLDVAGSYFATVGKIRAVPGVSTAACLEEDMRSGRPEILLLTVDAV